MITQIVLLELTVFGRFFMDPDSGSNLDLDSGKSPIRIRTKIPGSETLVHSLV